jgi:hypothetical protein
MIVMGFLTEREKEILRHLREGKSVMDIGKLLEVPVTSVSRSITSIKRKARDIEEDIAFLREIGYLSFDKGKMKFISADRDPKALGRLR